MGNVCNAASRTYHITKGVFGLVSIGVAIYSYLTGDIIQGIFLSIVFVFTSGDVVLNWSKYRLLENIMSDMSENNKNLEDQNSTFKKTNTSLSKNNDRLEIKIDNLEDLNVRYTDNINDLTDNTVVLAGEIQDLEIIKKNYSKQLQFLTNDNKLLSVNIEKMSTNLEKNRQIQINSRKLINSLMAAGDEYKEFNKIFEENVSQLQDTEKMLDILVNGLRKDIFHDMDEDNDGFITQEEYNRYIKQKK